MCSLEGSGGIHPVFFFIMLWWFWGSLGAWWHSSCLMLWLFWWFLGRFGLLIGIIWPRQNTTIMIVGFWDGFLVPFWDIWGAMGHPMAPIFAPRSWASWLARVTWRPVGIHPSALWRLIFLALYSWFCFCFIFLHLHSWFDIPGCRFLVLFFRFYIPGFIFRFIFLADLV